MFCGYSRIIFVFQRYIKMLCQLQNLKHVYLFHLLLDLMAVLRIENLKFDQHEQILGW